MCVCYVYFDWYYVCCNWNIPCALKCNIYEKKSMCISQASTIHIHTIYTTPTHAHRMRFFFYCCCCCSFHFNSVQFQQQQHQQYRGCPTVLTWLTVKHDDIDSIFASLLTHISRSWIIQCKFHKHARWGWLRVCDRASNSTDCTIYYVLCLVSCRVRARAPVLPPPIPCR